MIRTILAALWMAGALFAQAGHWEGVIQTPDGDLNFEIDLAQDPSAGWMGTLAIPAQRTKGLALIDVSVKDNAVSFGIKAPGDPRFKGTLAKEGGKMSGEMTQGGATMTFRLARTGEAKFEKAVRNPPLSKELEGVWEGTLDAGGQQLRLRFVLSNQAGAGTGTLFSLDQGAEIPIAGISQEESRVKLEIPVIDGRFEGDLKGAQLAGKWSQAGRSFPLTLTKAAK
jgi:hypothetical protein